MQRIACVVNPSRKLAPRALQALTANARALGFPDPVIYETTIAEPGEAQAHLAVADGADLVIAAGGDGTVRNVAAALAGTTVPLGILPIGTANIFHLNAIGKRTSLDASVRTALLGEPVSVDMGRVKLWQHSADSPINTRFLVVVGIGNDAATILGVSERWKRRIGPLAYFASGARTLLQPSMPMTITVDGERLHKERAWSLLVGNCGVVPGGITVLPNADVTDGQLHLLHVAPGNPLNWLPIGIAGITGHKRTPSGLTSMEAQHVTVEPESPMPVQVDGDVVEHVIRMEVTLEPETLLLRGATSR